SILEKIGKVFNDYKKEHHYPARYGGEEFVYLIETNDRQEVYRVSEHLRKAMKDLGKKNNVNLSISIGCVFKSINSKETFNVITLADQLLYQAKREGKDKVVFKSF